MCCWMGTAACACDTGHCTVCDRALSPMQRSTGSMQRLRAIADSLRAAGPEPASAHLKAAIPQGDWWCVPLLTHTRFLQRVTRRGDCRSERGRCRRDVAPWVYKNAPRLPAGSAELRAHMEEHGFAIAAAALPAEKVQT